MIGWVRRAAERGLRLVGELTLRSAELQLVDRMYTVAAAMFVSLLPVLLLLTSVFNRSNPAEPSLVANQIIRRLSLSGSAADSVRVLLPRGQASFYALGIGVTLYGLFTMSRRVARVYTSIWRVPDLKLAQLWRALVWVLLQSAALVSVAELRDFAGGVPLSLRLLTFGTAFAVWFGTDFAAQRLLTRGLVRSWRLALAAGLVAVARLAVAIWSSLYLASSLTRQAELYGPVGVVFSLFTSLFATVGASFVATMLAQVLTENRSARA